MNIKRYTFGKNELSVLPAGTNIVVFRQGKNDGAVGKEETGRSLSYLLGYYYGCMEDVEDRRTENAKRVIKKLKRFRQFKGLKL